MSTKERAPRRTPSRGAQSGSRDGTPAGPAEAVDVAIEEVVVETVADDSGNSDASEAPPEATGESSEQLTDAGMPTEQEYRGWLSSIKKAATSVVKKVTSTVKDHAKSAINAGLPIAGTAIGGFFGGPAGAALGGKAGAFAGGFVREMPETAEEAQSRAIQALDEFEVESAQLDQIIDQVLNETLPVVIDEISRDFSERGSRGEGGPADDEVMERFWGKAFGKIASAIADELPWAIKKATQYLGDGGSRDADSIDPLMLDPEVAQRFWGPAFSSIVTSLQSVLPTAFKLISGQSREVNAGDVTIEWQDLEETARLRGGDNIMVTGQSSIDDPSMVELSLELPPHKSWWKGLQVRGADDSVLASVDVEGATKTGSVRVAAEALRAPGARLVFTKADGLYKLPAAGLPDLAGKRVDFYWYAG